MVVFLFYDCIRFVSSVFFVPEKAFFYVLKMFFLTLITPVHSPNSLAKVCSKTKIGANVTQAMELSARQFSAQKIKDQDQPMSKTSENDAQPTRHSAVDGYTPVCSGQ